MADGITGEQAPHYGGNRFAAGFQQQVEMIGQQGPGQAERLGRDENLTQALDKIVPIMVIRKYNLAMDAAANDVMHGTGGVYARFSGHVQFGSTPLAVKQFIISWMSPIGPGETITTFPRVPELV
jgi:hypothetical protein